MSTTNTAAAPAIQTAAPAAKLKGVVKQVSKLLNAIYGHLQEYFPKFQHIDTYSIQKFCKFS